MASEVSICNEALTFLGDSTIVALSDGNERARACQSVFEEARDMALEAFHWNCAQHQATLAQDSDTPIFGFDYQYAIPTDPECLAVNYMYESEEGEGGYTWRVEGNYVLTDAETCNIRYTKKLTVVNDMTTRLREAIAARLAVLIAVRVTGKKARRDDAAAWFNSVIGKAVEIDASEDGDPPTYTDDWESARD